MGSYYSKTQNLDHVGGKRRRSIEDDTEPPQAKRACTAQTRDEPRIISLSEAAAIQDELIRRYPPPASEAESEEQEDEQEDLHGASIGEQLQKLTDDAMRAQGNMNDINDWFNKRVDVHNHGQIFNVEHEGNLELLLNLMKVDLSVMTARIDDMIDDIQSTSH
ncbi:hypothetical protein FPSE_03002 [Fusarium pseudograminearum CS3096]|uniref:Uncharacterized protein n=2 Tax=Fusarium pseudograminearum TaxID=101028 RepID=K3UW35_FUSPC|nr:hypothetical protein FPSE_03002 [Fusarium pseudograminearum CS3096]EKJ76816.1 hypothetical protein FPSE_03002 [Fusarium pseudograminearum CS3096]CEG02938.1 unnamed protein product [Fusarium pseudograminearum CS3487]